MAGRPRQFDIDVAVEIALKLFIEKGYEGASFADLTDAMGISPPSFYAAFGSKERLFRRALERYGAGVKAILAQAIARPSAREVIEHLLLTLSKAVTKDPIAKGCLLLQGALVSSDSSAGIRKELQQEREAITKALATRFVQAQKTRDPTLPGDPKAIARLSTMVLIGIAAQAASGIQLEQLTAAVKGYIAMFARKEPPGE